jgi:hypothetical protein
MCLVHTPTCARTETHRVQGKRMIWIILAAGLGANFIVVVLLFRRLRRDLGRQLRDMRAEHNSEAILSALKGTPKPTQQQTAQRVANGNWLETAPPPGGQEPVRRKKHLGLFIGGGAVAAFAVTLGQAARAAWQMHRGQVIGAAVAGAVVTTATVLVLAYAPWRDGDNAPSSSAPTAGPTASYTQTPPRGPTPSANPSQSAGGPQPSESSSPSGSVPGRASPMDTTSVIPIGEEPEPTAAPSSPVQSPPPSAVPPGSPTPEPTTPSQPPSVEPSADEPPDASGQCLGVSLAPVLNIEACLLGGGGG